MSEEARQQRIIVPKEIKLYVRCADGEDRLLEIALPIGRITGDSMWSFTDANGTDFYFTKDGHYDGWGKATH